MGATLRLTKQRIVQQHGILGSDWGLVHLIRRALFAFGLFALSSLLTPSTLKARQPDEAHEKTIPIKELANQIKSNQIKSMVSLRGDWEIHHLDEQPSVAINTRHGFRLVLRREWKHYTNPPRQQEAIANADPGPFELRHADWEFVLFPRQPEKAPSALKDQIEWQKSNSPFHTRNIWMGEGHGYSWFSHGTIYAQERVREKLALKGGDDRIQLAIDALFVKDKGTMTVNSCEFIPAKFGDRALPYVRKAIEQSGNTDSGRVVRCLAYFRTPKSTELLLELYDSGNDDLRRPAEYALIREPFHKEAKHAYFDMLKRQSRVNHGSKACLEFGWKDALPILQEVIARPRNFRCFQTAIKARRTLEGNPISQEILDAEDALRSTMNPKPDAATKRKIESARQLLIHSKDMEAANLAALSLVYFRAFKANSEPVNETGIEILQLRPRQSTIGFLKSLIDSVQYPGERAKIEAILLHCFK